MEDKVLGGSTSVLKTEGTERYGNRALCLPHGFGLVRM